MPVKVWRPSWRVVAVDWGLQDRTGMFVPTFMDSPPPVSIVEHVSRFKTFEEALEVARAQAVHFAAREGISHSLVLNDDYTIRVGGEALNADEMLHDRPTDIDPVLSTYTVDPQRWRVINRDELARGPDHAARLARETMAYAMLEKGWRR